jgi:hypothetical protein
MTNEEIKAEFYALATKMREAGHYYEAARAEMLAYWFTDLGFQRALADYVYEQLTIKGD